MDGKFKIAIQNSPALAGSRPEPGHRREKFLILICSFAFCILNFKLTCSARPVSSTELINQAKEYDGKTVAFEGEAIGEIMRRGDFAWVNLHDGQNAIGCWMEYALAKQIAYLGSYKNKGDWVEVSGVFRRACPEHGGDLDIHAQALRKIYNGRSHVERLSPDKRNIALIMLGILCLVLILKRLKSR